jgi:predicted amidohydrolase
MCTNGTLYASHMVITPQGRTGIYRKLHLAPPESDYFSPGESLPVFQWSGIRFGIQLCAMMPISRIFLHEWQKPAPI